MPGFSSFLQKLDQGLVRSDTEGSSKLEKAYAGDPESRDFITAYESSALSAVTSNPDLVMIYPNPTDVADQGVAVMTGPWTTPAQQATAEKFVKFLASGDSVSDGIQYYFRPALGETTAFKQRLTGGAQDQYRDSYTSIGLVSYDALNDAASIYNLQKR